MGLPQKRRAILLEQSGKWSDLYYHGDFNSFVVKRKETRIIWKCRPEATASICAKIRKLQPGVCCLQLYVQVRIPKEASKMLMPGSISDGLSQISPTGLLLGIFYYVEIPR